MLSRPVQHDMNHPFRSLGKLQNTTTTSLAAKKNWLAVNSVRVVRIVFCITLTKSYRRNQTFNEVGRLMILRMLNRESKRYVQKFSFFFFKEAKSDQKSQ